MSDKAFVTPDVIKWARESARMSEETAACKVHVSVEKLQEWEEGISLPTIKQAETLSKAYKRSFAIFFLPKIPNDFIPLKDFRQKTAKPLGTASIFIIREIQQKQAWLKDVFEENKEQLLTFVGRFSLNDNPVEVANDIIQTLQIHPSRYTMDKPIKEWIDKAESNGIFISRTSSIHSRLTLDNKEIQGFTIADPYAPFVFVNSKEWDAPQLFTLIHELAHIWVAESGVSGEIEPELMHKDEIHTVELFCNAVAANVLMPENIMKNLETTIFDSVEKVFRKAKSLGVSSFAFLVRALNMQLISLHKYSKLKSEAQKKFEEFLENEKMKKTKQKGGKEDLPIYYPLMLNKNGRLFTQVVLDAFHGGSIQPTQASSLLGIKVNNFPKLEAQMYK